jgi:uncharacterized protein YdaU (DUF1376 family)
MDWFPWYPERYRNKTLHLTAEQDGIYRRLIDHYMETRQPLPDNDYALARISGVDNECFKHASSIIRAFFKQSKGGILSHDTCNQMLDEQDKQAKFRTERAERAANKRWRNQKDTCFKHASSNAQAMLEHATITKTVTETKVSKDTIIIPQGVSETVWKDFIAHRKAKKAPVSKTALAGIEREADKAGITLEQALETLISRGWTGFKAEWIKEKQNGKSINELRGHAAMAELGKAARRVIEQEELQGQSSQLTTGYIVERTGLLAGND